MNNINQRFFLNIQKTLLGFVFVNLISLNNSLFGADLWLVLFDVNEYTEVNFSRLRNTHNKDYRTGVWKTNIDQVLEGANFEDKRRYAAGKTAELRSFIREAFDKEGRGVPRDNIDNEVEAYSASIMGYRIAVARAKYMQEHPEIVRIQAACRGRIVREQIRQEEARVERRRRAEEARIEEEIRLVEEERRWQEGRRIRWADQEVAARKIQSLLKK